MVPVYNYMTYFSIYLVEYDDLFLTKRVYQPYILAELVTLHVRETMMVKHLHNLIFINPHILWGSIIYH